MSHKRKQYNIAPPHKIQSFFWNIAGFFYCKFPRFPVNLRPGGVAAIAQRFMWRGRRDKSGQLLVSYIMAFSPYLSVLRKVYAAYSR